MGRRPRSWGLSGAPAEPRIDHVRGDLDWLWSNKPLLIAQLLGAPLMVAYGLFLYLGEHILFGLVLVVLLPVAVVANVAMVNRSRRRLADRSARRDDPTGAFLDPKPAPAGVLSAPLRWVGAADVPSLFGRMNASVPLGVLELDGSLLTFRVRPRLLAKLFGMHQLVVRPFEVEAVYPARARLRYPAIAVRPLGQPPYYFLLGDRGLILSCIAEAGFPVSWQERQFSYS